MSRINRIPKGIQNLFGNVAAGMNPNELLQDVRPSIDLTQFWSVEQIDHVGAVGSFGAVFQQNLITVPAGQLWIPISFSLDITTTVIGESVAASIGISDAANTSRVHLASTPYVVSIAALETVIATYTWNQVQPVAAQNNFYAQCHRFVAAAARNTGMRLKFIRLLV